MSRRNKPPKRTPVQDPIYNSTDVAKFINRIMRRGKKSLAQRIFYDSMNMIQEKTKKEPMEVFQQALKNVVPLIEVKARRIGGSTYQVPTEVSPERGAALGSNWIIDIARGKSGKPMNEKLAAEILSAANGEGAAVKKREDTHKMAEANKAFAHYRY
ncbi:MAG: 30S ribosomal protein S7 [Candidatus Melainabacteria bacterium GWF2_37_15]|nr:MAG: 30S ribosomal protein S7 [Candidatus Melainabacteria bacterium GWF2_37_15]